MDLSKDHTWYFAIPSLSAIIGKIPFPTMFTDEYVSTIEINIPRASFRIFGSDGCIKNIECDNADDFMHVWKITETAKNIDEEIEVKYIK